MGMHILHIVTQRQYRGAEIFTAQLSADLLRLGHRVTLVGLYAPGEPPLEVPGAEVYDLCISPRPFLSWSGVKRLRHLFKTLRPDVVQANGSATLKYACMARWGLPGVPLLYRNISMISAWAGEQGWRRWFYRWLFKQVDHVTSVGERTRADFIRFYGYPADRISVIRRGVPVRPADREAVRQALVSEWGLHAADFIVMHMGSFSPEKNHLFLLEVWSLLPRHARCILLLVGEGKERARITEAVKARGLADRIFFAGFRPAETMLPGADVLVLCSHVEGVPGVILEAATFGIPAVAVDVGGVGEVVRAGETGRLLTRHDANAFAAALHELMEDRPGLQRLGRQAQAYVATEFDPTKNAKRFADLYGQLIQQGSGR